jgi:hypothetical protein
MKWPYVRTVRGLGQHIDVFILTPRSSPLLPENVHQGQWLAALVQLWKRVDRSSTISLNSLVLSKASREAFDRAYTYEHDRQALGSGVGA